MRTIKALLAGSLLVYARGCAGGERSEDMMGGGGGIGGPEDDGDTDLDEDDGEARFDVAGGTGDEDADPDGSEGGCDQDVDIVFVMDVSTSMGPFLSKLADEILVVDGLLKQLQLPSAPRYGLVLFVDDTMIENGGQAYSDVLNLKAAFQMWSAFTASNLQINGANPNTTWPENSLDALFDAATTFDWRPPGEDTLRIVIHTTDDTFWDGPTVGNGEPVTSGWSETVEALQTEQVRVFSFADRIGGQCECEDVSRGWFGPYDGGPSMGDATDGGVFFLPDVLAGNVSLADAIKGAVEDKLCVPYPPQG